MKAEHGSRSSGGKLFNSFSNNYLFAGLWIVCTQDLITFWMFDLWMHKEQIMASISLAHNAFVIIKRTKTKQELMYKNLVY